MSNGEIAWGGDGIPIAPGQAGDTERLLMVEIARPRAAEVITRGNSGNKILDLSDDPEIIDSAEPEDQAYDFQDRPKSPAQLIRIFAIQPGKRLRIGFNLEGEMAEGWMREAVGAEKEWSEHVLQSDEGRVIAFKFGLIIKIGPHSVEEDAPVPSPRIYAGENRKNR